MEAEQLTTADGYCYMAHSIINKHYLNEFSEQLWEIILNLQKRKPRLM